MDRILGFLGYPNQSLKRIHEVLTLTQEVGHPFSSAYALGAGAWIYQCRREVPAAQEWAEATIALSGEHGFALRLAWGKIVWGWALAEQGQGKEGITQMRLGLADLRATGASNMVPYFLALLAEAYGTTQQAEDGLAVVTDALAIVNKTGECFYEAELYRLKGELTLQFSVKSQESRVKKAEECFLKAIEIARKQQAKSLELRAATSLARLWLHQGKRAEAHKLLSEIYNWFTEGFDTKDLQEAKALIESLSD